MGDALGPVQLGATPIRSVSIGHAHGCAVVGPDVKCWRDNYYYESSADDVTETSLFGDDLPTLALGSAHRPLAVMTTLGVSCVLSDDAAVRCWGNPGPGLFGDGRVDDGRRSQYARPSPELAAVPLPEP